MAELKEGILKLFKEHYGMTDEEAQEYYKEQFEIVKKTKQGKFLSLYFKVRLQKVVKVRRRNEKQG